MVALITFIIIVLISGIIALFAGKRFALLFLGLFIGYNLINEKVGGGFLGIGAVTPKLADCLTNFSTCSNSQIIGLIIIVGSIILAFIPSSKLK